jgi:hypothetical protein
MDPEPGYRLKLRRAKEHLDAINGEVDVFVERNLGPAVGFEPKPEDEWTTFYYGTVKPPDPMWGTMLGDYIHNVRSALDNLVCAMIRRNDPDHSLEHAAFPAYEGRKKWNAEIVNREADGRPPTDGVTSDVLAAIERSQPYHIQGVAARRRAPLLLLQTASNLDKHRILHAARIQVAPRSVHPGNIYASPTGFFQLRQGRIAPEGTTIETGAEMGRAKIRVIAFPPPGTQVGVYAHTPADVAFAVPGHAFEVTHRDVWAMLGDAWQAVLRVEHAAGIDIGAFPLPHDDWTWHPDDDS